MGSKIEKCKQFFAALEFWTLGLIWQRSDSCIGVAFPQPAELGQELQCSKDAFECLYDRGAAIGMSLDALPKAGLRDKRGEEYVVNRAI